jgi:VanZ family protein
VRYRSNSCHQDVIKSSYIPGAVADIKSHRNETIDVDAPMFPKWLRYAGAVGCALLILYASVIEPGEGVPRTLFGVGVTVYLHVIAYGVLTATIGYAMRSADRRTLLVAVTIATLYGAGIELLQGTIPYRTMAATDVLINAIGAVCGAGLWWAIAPRVGLDRLY